MLNKILIGIMVMMFVSGCNVYETLYVEPFEEVPIETEEVVEIGIPSEKTTSKEPEIIEGYIQRIGDYNIWIDNHKYGDICSIDFNLAMVGDYVKLIRDEGFMTCSQLIILNYTKTSHIENYDYAVAGYVQRIYSDNIVVNNVVYENICDGDMDSFGIGDYVIIEEGNCGDYRVHWQYSFVPECIKWENFTKKEKCLKEILVRNIR